MDLGSYLFGSDPEKYNNDSQTAQAARTFQGPDTRYNVKGANAGQAQQSAADTAIMGQQQDLATALRGASQGQGPSAAVMAGQQSRDAALSQAAALQAGRRGQNAAGAATAGAMASSQGIQAANQQQAQGQANEMATTRGQLGSILGTMGGQQLQNQQFNAGQGNQMAQFNAGMEQQANLANQQTQYGIGSQLLGANEQENQMAFSNLNPGSQGALVGLAGDAAKIGAAAMAKGGVVMPHFDDGGTVSPPDVSRYAAPQLQPQPTNYGQIASNGGGLGQALSIGQRVMPMWNVRQRQAQAGAQTLADAIANKLTSKKQPTQAHRDAREELDATTTDKPSAADSSPSDQQDQVAPTTDASSVPIGPAMARGGTVKGPTPALVGEAGPELVVHLGDALRGRPLVPHHADRPQVMALGVSGPDAVVNRKQRAEGKELLAKGDGSPSPVVSGLADVADRVSRLERLSKLPRLSPSRTAMRGRG